MKLPCYYTRMHQIPGTISGFLNNTIKFLLTKLQLLYETIDFRHHGHFPVLSKRSPKLHPFWDPVSFLRCGVSELVHPFSCVGGEISKVDLLGDELRGVIPGERHDDLLTAKQNLDEMKQAVGTYQQKHEPSVRCISRINL